MAAAQGFIAAAENDELSWIRALASGLRDYAGSGTWNPDLTTGSADFGKCLESIIDKGGLSVFLALAGLTGRNV